MNITNSFKYNEKRYAYRDFNFDFRYSVEPNQIENGDESIGF